MKTIAIIGLGYVGLPLAVEFGKKRKVIGYDIDKNRIAELKQKYDRTKECDANDLAKAEYLELTSEIDALAGAQIFIVTVPTPITKAKVPDFKPLIDASTKIGRILKKNDIVIYESTVYPGATEEICVPILEQESGLIYNGDFYCGYSPERINPGDKTHTLKDIIKITSGSTPEIAIEIDELYREIINAGTYPVEKIRIAEAAKVIENTQRDLNIALMNELSLLCARLDIDTTQVIDAAATKWNFIKFKPGLVGGHCIGVDPYYLTYKAQEVGMNPSVILSGRQVNDSMAEQIVNQILQLMVRNNTKIGDAKILILGATFKEDCPDIRNSKVIDLINKFKSLKFEVCVCDPHADTHQMRTAHKIECSNTIPISGNFDAIVLAVAHKEFKEMGSIKIKSLGKPNLVFYDLKSVFAKSESTARL